MGKLIISSFAVIFIGVAFTLYNRMKEGKYNDLPVTIRPPTKEEIKIAESWPIWDKEKCEFDMVYDQTEYCLILKGQVEIQTKNKRYSFKGGDYVIFPKGLKCRWIIKEDVSKHYHFS